MRFYPRANRNGSCECTCVYRHIGICPYRLRRRNSCAFSSSIRIFFNCALVITEIEGEISNKIEYDDIAVRPMETSTTLLRPLTYFIFQLVPFIAVITMLSTSVSYLFSHSPHTSQYVTKWTWNVWLWIERMRQVQIYFYFLLCSESRTTFLNRAK